MANDNVIKFDFEKEFAVNQPNVTAEKKEEPKEATIFDFDSFITPKTEPKKEEPKPEPVPPVKTEMEKIKEYLLDNKAHGEYLSEYLDECNGKGILKNFKTFIQKKETEKKTAEQFDIATVSKTKKDTAVPANVKDSSKMSADQNLIEMIEYFNAHWYKIKGNVYPSVTTILTAYPGKYDGLMSWRGEVGNEEASKRLKTAGEQGSLVHDFKTRMLMGTKFYYGYAPEDAEQPYQVVKDQGLYIQAYRLYQFFHVVKPVVIMDEMKLYSDKYQVAGSADLLLEIKDGNYMIDGKKPVYLPSGYYIADLKTSNYLHPEYWLQVAAYSKMFEETYPNYNIRGNLILHTKSKNEFGIEGFACKVVLTDSEKTINNYFDDFLKVKACWDLLEKSAPTDYVFPKEFQLTKNIGA